MVLYTKGKNTYSIIYAYNYFCFIIFLIIKREMDKVTLRRGCGTVVQTIQGRNECTSGEERWTTRREVAAETAATHKHA